MELVNESGGLKKKAKLFKKNMENAVESGKGILIFALVMTAASFLLCRAAFFGSFFPCGAALITALMYKNRLNIYLLPVMALSMWTCLLEGYYIWGDLAATLLCGAAFILLGRKGWNLLLRSLIAACVTVIANCAYFLGAHMLYRFSISMIILEAALVIMLTYGFFFFLKIWFAGDKPVEETMEKIVAVTVLVLAILFNSQGLSDVANLFSVTLIGCLFLVLLVGYKMGVLPGVTAGGLTGTVLVLCGGSAPALIFNLLCGGLAAGLFKGQMRVYAAICFAGACLAPTLIQGRPEFSLPVYAPLCACLLLLLMRRKWLDRINPMEEQIYKEEIKNDVRLKEQMVYALEGRVKNFEFLANLYGNRRDARAVMGYQFSGLANVAKSMLSEIGGISQRDAAALKGAPFYRVKKGEACYARKGNVSGDSYICREIREEKYIMVLSDGMGKGEAAAAESSLAVNTLSKLLEAGFDAEAAIRTINSILLMQTKEEIFSTIDLGVLDLKTGKLKMFKVGAAATFVKRRDKVTTVKMNALPMGIVDGLHIDYINVRLHRGDQIIMVSDGIIDSCRDDINADWLMEAIAGIKSKDPQTMADLIINRAVENYGLREKDDLTVLTFRVD